LGHCSGMACGQAVQASQFLEKYGTRNAVHQPPVRATLPA
jgi:hypothetical protein